MKTNNTLTNRYPDWHSKPLRLTINEMKMPEVVVRNFFDNFSLRECRQYLEDILLTAATGSADTYDGKQIGDWLYFHQQLQTLVEGAFILNQSKKNGVGV